METMQTKTDQQIKAEIDSHRAGRSLGKIIMYAGMGLVILFLIMGKILFPILFALLVIIPGGLIMIHHENAIKEILGEQVVKNLVLDAFGPETTYEPFGCIAEEEIRRADIRLPSASSLDKVRGTDRICALYQGLHIEMSDVSLIHVDISTDDDGDSTETEKEIFKGQWMICDFGKELSAEVRLSEYSKKFPRRLKNQTIRLENEAFNSRFLVFSENPHEVFYLLTPHMMEYILAMSDRSGKNVYMSFLRGGKLHIAVNSGKDFFELGKGKTDIDLLRSTFLSEIKWFTDMIDELRVSETLYRP